MTNVTTTAATLAGRLLLGVLLAIGSASAARADAVSYALTFCENLDVLRDPTNKTLAMNAAWVTQHSLMLGRTMPYLELRNTSADALLTQLNLTIGDQTKNYDWSELIEASPGVGYSLVTPDGVMGGQKSDELLINFSNLGPGDFVRFRIGLSADDPSAGFVQDYRMTLFQLDGSDPSSNAIATVSFEDGEGTTQLVEQLPNYSFGGIPTSTSLAFPRGYSMDMVMPFTLTDSGTIEPEDDDDGQTNQVPEPDSVLLLSVGMLAFIGWRLHCRRRAAS
ncbi:MAG: PEP-CTERM sorting domain-containing protein [Planctomycetota bacterium]|nr:MAG: PEP-CTERM sorting domain-containing protein [Planctomycetota bacterium]